MKNAAVSKPELGAQSHDHLADWLMTYANDTKRLESEPWWEEYATIKAQVEELETLFGKALDLAEQNPRIFKAWRMLSSSERLKLTSILVAGLRAREIFETTLQE